MRLNSNRQEDGVSPVWELYSLWALCFSGGQKHFLSLKWYEYRASLCQYFYISGTSSFSRWSTDGMGSRNSKVAKQMGNSIQTKRWDHSSRLKYMCIGLEKLWSWLMGGWYLNSSFELTFISYYLLLNTHKSCMDASHVHVPTNISLMSQLFHHTWLILAMMWKALFILAFLIILNALESMDFKSQH